MPSSVKDPYEQLTSGVGVHQPGEVKLGLGIGRMELDGSRIHLLRALAKSREDQDDEAYQPSCAGSHVFPQGLFQPLEEHFKNPPGHIFLGNYDSVEGQKQTLFTQLPADNPGVSRGFRFRLRISR